MRWATENVVDAVDLKRPIKSHNLAFLTHNQPILDVEGALSFGSSGRLESTD